MELNGIDVSQHQGKIDWKKVAKAGVDFAIIRVGFGKYAKQVDKQFAANYEGCVKNKIPRGLYWYSYATTPEDAVLEAKACLSIIGKAELQYPIYFDIEDKCQDSLSQVAASAICKAFCDEIEKAGYWAGIYTYNAFTAKLTPEVKKRYAFWLADTRKAVKPNYSYPYGIWQYSWVGKVNGINGNVDLDKCYVDYPSLIAEKAEAKPEPEHTVYTVKKGDCLWNIAKQFYGDGSKYTRIVKYNGLTATVIKVGQLLAIPK